MLNALCIVYQAEVKNPAGTVLHSCASTSLTQRITPQANSHPSAAKAMQISGACKTTDSEMGKQRVGSETVLSSIVRQGSEPSSLALLTWCPPDVIGGEAKVEVALDSRAPPTYLFLAFLFRTPLGIMETLSRILGLRTNSVCLLPSFDHLISFPMDRDLIFIFTPTPSTCNSGFLLYGELFGLDEQVWVPCGTREMLELGELNWGLDGVLRC